MVTNEPVKHLSQSGGPYRGVVLYVGTDTGRFYGDFCASGGTERRAFDSREELEAAASQYMNPPVPV